MNSSQGAVALSLSIEIQIENKIDSITTDNITIDRITIEI